MKNLIIGILAGLLWKNFSETRVQLIRQKLRKAGFKIWGDNDTTEGWMFLLGSNTLGDGSLILWKFSYFATRPDGQEEEFFLLNSAIKFLKNKPL